MALIECPGCGQKISDKSEKCVKCGFVIKQEKKNNFCMECGAEIQEGATVCSQCGCPVPNAEEKQTQQVEVTNINLKMEPKKLKRIIIGIVIGVILIVGLVIGGIAIKNQVEQKKQEEAAESYAENLETIASLILDGGAQAEDCCNLIHDVWSDAIYEEYEVTTADYVCPDGDFVDDFNTALFLLFLDDGFTSDIDEIKENQTKVQSMMKDMTNPPEEYEEAYTALKDLYNSYLELTNMAIDPTGSLSTFTSNFNDADNTLVNKYKALMLYID